MDYNQRNLGKNFLKNGYVFMKRFFRDESFYSELRVLFDKWPSSAQQTNPLGIAWDQELPKIKENDEKAYKQRIEFLDKLEEASALSFFDDVEEFLKRCDLGKEWILTITDYLISGWIHPPMENLNLTEDDKRLVLVLNPDTSLEDLKDIWPRIKEEQKRLWPNYKKTNYSKKMFGNLFRALQDRDKRAMGRGIRLDLAENKEYKVRDKDLVGELWEADEDTSLETDRKRMVNLRQIRKRFRDK